MTVKKIINAIIITLLILSLNGCTRQKKLADLCYNKSSNILNLHIQMDVTTRETSDRKLLNKFYDTIKGIKYSVQIEDIENNANAYYKILHDMTVHKESVYEIGFTVLTPEKRHFHEKIYIFNDRNFIITDFDSMYKITNGKLNIDKIKDIYNHMK